MRLTITLVLCSLVAAASAKHHSGYFDEIIKYVNAGDYSWKAGHNHITTMGRHAHILAGSRYSQRSLQNKPRVSHSSIPKSFDSRQHWPHCQSIWSIKDQGNCGTCWAVSTASVMSDRVCIASGGKTQVNISAENLAACCVDCGVGCNGGYPDLAWPYFISDGLVTGGDYHSGEGCQPYEVKPTGVRGSEVAPSGVLGSNQYLVCHRNKCTNKKYTDGYKQDLHYGKTAYLLPNNVEAIQAEIMTNGPVVAGYTVYDDFYSYRSGVYKHVKGGEVGGHAVRILGWGVENGQDYWLIANSWGRNWGEKGYFKFIRGINNCGMEEFVTGGLVEPN